VRSLFFFFLSRQGGRRISFAYIGRGDRATGRGGLSPSFFPFFAGDRKGLSSLWAVSEDDVRRLHFFLALAIRRRRVFLPPCTTSRAKHLNKELFRGSPLLFPPLFQTPGRPPARTVRPSPPAPASAGGGRSQAAAPSFLPSLGKAATRVCRSFFPPGSMKMFSGLPPLPPLWIVKGGRILLPLFLVVRRHRNHRPFPLLVI